VVGTQPTDKGRIAMWVNARQNQCVQNRTIGFSVKIILLMPEGIDYTGFKCLKLNNNFSLRDHESNEICTISITSSFLFLVV
jgi:hypothetical protein